MQGAMDGISQACNNYDLNINTKTTDVEQEMQSNSWTAVQWA